MLADLEAVATAGWLGAGDAGGEADTADIMLAAPDMLCRAIGLSPAGGLLDTVNNLMSSESEPVVCCRHHFVVDGSRCHTQPSMFGRAGIAALSQSQ